MPSPKHESIASLVDQALAAKKSLEGEPDWAKGNRDGENRLSMPVKIKGEVSHLTLGITAYPNDPQGLRFTVTLNWPPCIWRVDFDPEHEWHLNPLDRAQILGGYRISGRHFHGWNDNRHLATHSALPDSLKCARQLPKSIRTFDDGLRWFCSEVNIVLPKDHGIIFPQKTSLL